MQAEKKPMTKEEYRRENLRYLTVRENIQNDPYRQSFHLQPPLGWLNDPNGLCQIGGVYHIYFQYTPFNPEGGTGLWGHMTTEDFIHYQEHEPCIFPDSPWDANGAYSGSAFYRNGTYYFFYTGNVKYTHGKYDYITEGREQNVILTTTEDGFSFSKKKLVMTNKDYPQDMSLHVRDPQILESDGRYYMVLGARSLADHGSVLMFESSDLETWTYKLRFTTEFPFGYMWECPNFVCLDGKKFLIVCPQGVAKQGLDYANIYQCGYFPLDYNFGENEYSMGDFVQLDRGFDFYAPQVFRDHLGRTIIIGWMGMPDSEYNNQITIKNGWQHVLTLPRELYVTKAGKLAQRPVKELRKLRGHKRELCFQHSFCVKVSPRFEMKLTMDKCTGFCLKIREYTRLIYEEGVLTLDMEGDVGKRGSRGVLTDHIRNIRILSDSSSMEIFINDGEEVFTTRVYDSMNNLECALLEGESDGFLKVYELNPCHVF